MFGGYLFMCWLILIPVLIWQKPPGKLGLNRYFSCSPWQASALCSQHAHGGKAPWQKPANKHCTSCAWCLQVAAKWGAGVSQGRRHMGPGPFLPWCIWAAVSTLLLCWDWGITVGPDACMAVKNKELGAVAAISDKSKKEAGITSEEKCSLATKMNSTGAGFS